MSALGSALLAWIIAAPCLFAALMLLIPAKRERLQQVVLFFGFLVNLLLCCILLGKNLAFSLPWVGFGFAFSLRLYSFSGIILGSAGILAFFIALYTASYSAGKGYTKKFFATMLFTMTLVNGAVLADNLAVLLFFWESILVAMFVMIALGGPKAYHTSIKAVVIVGISDLCLMLGIGIVAAMGKTLAMSEIRLPMTSWGILAFILLVIGAIAKAGSMPFHTWIPDAADEAPLPFMAFLPGAVEKLLGIYLLVRICLDFFDFQPGSAMSVLLQIVGAATIVFAVMMALIQKDFKRLLSYHAVSQVGYMILGIGTALPVGIIGSVFHMLNNAVYKSGLFLVAGSVERQTGTTDLNKLGGLFRRMPVTFACFAVFAASIAGFPLTNGFFSKELIFDGALESGLLFYIFALMGAFFTAVSFLKLGHAAFFGKQGQMNAIKDAPIRMLVPMIALAACCLLLGLCQSYVVGQVLLPALGLAQHGGEHVAFHTNWLLVGISAAVLLIASLDHLYGYKKTGSGLKAADHFHYAPGLHTIYEMAEKKYFDPYQIMGIVIRGYATLSLKLNAGINWIYDVLIVRIVNGASLLVRRAHNGSQIRYLAWLLSGTVLVIVLYVMTS